MLLVHFELFILSARILVPSLQKFLKSVVLSKVVFACVTLFYLLEVGVGNYATLAIIFCEYKGPGLLCYFQITF
jgi:hypothetical protein